MVEEAYVSFETAKLLKEKGFNERCHSHWWAQDIENPRWSDFEQNWNCASEDWYSRPSQQMAMRWLREVYDIFIGILYNLGWFVYFESSKRTDVPAYMPTQGYSTYEKACEAAIKYCLEHLI